MEERAREYLMLRMRTLRGIEEWEYRREFYMNFEPIQRKLEFYESRGWASQSGRRWHFTPEGFLLSNHLIAELLDVQGEAPPKLLEKQENRIPLFTQTPETPKIRSNFTVFKRKQPPIE